jgi:hypothetical protein
MSGVLLAAALHWQYFGWGDGRPFSIGVYEGAARLYWGSDFPAEQEFFVGPPYESVRATISALGSNGMLPTFTLIRDPHLHAVEWEVPLWLLLMVCALPASWLSRLECRVQAPGACRCDYDLTGNTSGTCPECGKAAHELLNRREVHRLR